jgi:hypothetical protein
MRHPLVGTMTVTQQALRTEQDQSIVVATTQARSPSQAAMALLVHTAATSRNSAEASAESARAAPMRE